MNREDVKGSAVQNGSGWKITWECPEGAWNEDHPVSINFVIHSRLNDGDPLLKGNIKWDGCSNWIDADDEYFHLCGPRDVTNLYESMAMCYTIAGKYMPEAIE